MAKDPIIEPANVKLTTAFPSPRSSIVPPATSGGGAPTPVRFSFGPSNVAVVKMDGSVQAGLFAADDRKLCGLEFMQFATPGRFARVFKSEMGVSLVRYRNQLRLERFVKIMDGGDKSMHEAALAAGFGSYAQFHRVFHTLRGATPRAFLGRAGRRRRAT